MSAVLPSRIASPGSAPTAPRAPAGEWFIVMNRGSGAEEKDEARRTIETELAQAGRPYRFVAIGERGIVGACQDAARLAAEHDGIVVAAGGDGTINCAAQAALAHDCPIGLIPQGTFNLFARQLGMPLDPAAATRALLRGAPEAQQVGLVNQRVFLVNASVGLYPKLLADREVAKKKLGRRRVVAMLAALKSMLEWRLQLVLDAEIDGDSMRLRTASIFVCNNRLQLQRLGIAPEVVEKVGAGQLACLLVPRMGVWAKLRMLAGAAFGKLGEDRELRSLPLRSLGCASRSARRLKVATDGEVQWMELPLRFTVAPRPLHVMLPPVEERLPPQ